MSKPVPLGLRRSFGFGDRLGLATPGHLTAAKQFDFAPIFAQQSIREMSRTQRSPEEVMAAAQGALDRAGYEKPWGADADHLKTPEDVRRTADAGFCFFTIDPSEFVNDQADHLPGPELESSVAALETSGALPDPGWKEYYLGQAFEVSDGLSLRFTREALFRAATKYARAIGRTAVMSGAIQQACGEKPFEIEVSVDETDSATSPLEHLFYGLELKRRLVKVVSLAPRFPGDFEKGIDYRGDLASFEATLEQHAAIARFCGPYKISVHSGSDKFSAYPIIGRVCGDLLHVKTAGTSYLEALRVAARVAPELFAQIACYCRSRFETDRASYHISTTQAEVAALPGFSGPTEEPMYLDHRVGRQLLHVCFGSVLTAGQDDQGRPFKSRLVELLHDHADLHASLIEKHFVKHLSLLCQG